MITLYQRGRAATGGINSQNSEVDPELNRTPCVSFQVVTPPHPQGVYKKAGDAEHSGVSFQEERPSLGSSFQERNKASSGRSLFGENALMDVPYSQRASLSPLLQLFPRIGHHSPPSASLALFYVTDLSSTTISSNSPPWLPVLPPSSLATSTMAFGHRLLALH